MIDCVTAAGIFLLGKAGISVAAPLHDQCQALAGDVACASGHANLEHRALLPLKIRVREALSVAHWGEMDVSYKPGVWSVCSCMACRWARTHLTPHCVEHLEFLATAAARAQTAVALSRLLGSLGIPSDVGLVFDGVRIGCKRSPPARNFVPHRVHMHVGGAQEFRWFLGEARRCCVLPCAEAALAPGQAHGCAIFRSTS